MAVAVKRSHCLRSHHSYQPSDDVEESPDDLRDSRDLKFAAEDAWGTRIHHRAANGGVPRHDRCDGCATRGTRSLRVMARARGAAERLRGYSEHHW